MFEVLIINWWAKGDGSLAWWNHGSQLMYDGNDDSYVSYEKFKPFNHGRENHSGDSSIYANGFQASKGHGQRKDAWQSYSQIYNSVAHESPL